MGEPKQITCACGQEELLFCVINDGLTVVVICKPCNKSVARFDALQPFLPELN